MLLDRLDHQREVPGICMELKWFNFPRGEAFALPTEWRERFSLPAEWWIEAGMDRFERRGDLSYAARPQLTRR